VDRLQKKVTWYDDRAKLGQRLRAAREAAGLTQRDLATVNCTAAYVSRIEKGDRVPSAQLLREFADRLGVSEEYLAYGRRGKARPAFSLVEARVALRVGDFGSARELADAALSAATSDAHRADVSAFFGEIALCEGDYRGAIEAIERARSLDSSIELREPDAADALGRAYARASEYESAIAVFVRARQAAAEAGDALLGIRFASLLAHALTDSGDFKGAERAIAEALVESEGLDDPLTRVRTLWAQSRIQALQSNSDAAAAYAERALEILRVSDYSYYAALAHQLLAHIELDRGNVDRAVELLEEAAPVIRETGRVFEYARLEVERARALVKVGRPAEAASVAMAAAGALDGDLSIDAGRCYLLIGDVYAELDERDRALELYELSVELLKPMPNRYLVEAYSRLAALLEAKGDKSRALEVLKEAMSVQREADRMLASRSE
jgi:tetratricopeptide (TPR) repeat protein